MNDTEKAKAALAGLGGATGADDTADAGQSELEKMRHAKDVWAGRAKQYQEEKKALEEKLRKYESKKDVDEALNTLSDEDKDDMPERFLGASGKVAAELISRSNARQNEEIEKLRQQMAARDEQTFLNNIAMRHKDLFDSVQVGGDKHQYWERFIANNRETFSAVMASHDETRFANLVDGFYRELGIPVSGGGVVASPTPSTTGGGSPAISHDDSSVITTEQYLAELEKAEDMRKAGDMNGWRAVNERLRKALNEGRVK